MILSDRDIRKQIAEGRIEVDSPLADHDQNIHASSMDMRLGKFFKVYEHTKFAVLDPIKAESFKDLTKLIEITDPGEPFIVHPGDFVLGVTIEKSNYRTILLPVLKAEVLLDDLESLFTQQPVSLTQVSKAQSHWKFQT